MAWYKPKDIWKKNKRIITAVVTGGLSEVGRAVVKGVKEITGVNAMEEATAEQKRQYEEQKAAALAEEEALARKAEQEKADASASAYRKLEEERRRRAAMKGRRSTILTGSLGDTGLTVQRRTLLGG
jgi:Sec-independent protein translocase protein TatA